MMHSGYLKDLCSTKVKGRDFSHVEKDSKGGLYSPDGRCLLGIERENFDLYDYEVKEGTEVICDHAFSGTLIRDIIIPNSVIIIGHRAFDGCIMLQSVTIGEGVKTIESAAFRCCKKLKELVLPDNIETIGALAFYHTGLTNLIIPRQCSKIIGNPVSNNNVRIKSKSPYFVVENDILFTSNKHELISFQSSISSYTIPNSVIRISSYAFGHSTNLKSIVIPPSVQDIGINPFTFCNIAITNQSKKFSLKRGLLIDIRRKAIIGCYSMDKTIYIPDGINSIECSAFCNSKILEVKLPYSVRSIKDHAFEFSSIEKIKLPNSVKYLGNYVFIYCSSLKKVNLPKYLDYYGEGLFYKCTSIKKIDIPACIKYLKKGMFDSCYALEDVNISNSQQKICKLAFYGCLNLKEFAIPRTVDYIGKSAFQFCKRLKAVYIPDSVKYIGFKAFNDCQEITEHSRDRSLWHTYDSMNLIATTPGNKEKLIRMLPKFLHGIIKEMTYKEFVNRQKTLYSNVKTDEEYDFGSLKRIQCPRCGNWYFEDDGVCDICGYPWNE